MMITLAVLVGLNIPFAIFNIMEGNMLLAAFNIFAVLFGLYVLLH